MIPDRHAENTALLVFNNRGSRCQFVARPLIVERAAQSEPRVARTKLIRIDHSVFNAMALQNLDEQGARTLDAQHVTREPSQAGRHTGASE